ncbi:MAG: protein-disulfide reductase, partial [Giesbergeria sp.]|nr:protein-disulfide reductase [Giesbergeria sp.]
MSYRFFFRLLAALLFIAASALSTGVSAQLSFNNDRLQAGTSTSVVTTPRVRAELVAYAPQGVAAGQPLWLGLQIAHQPGWHTYWKNPGDSGLPTELRWTLPAGVDVGDIAWPVPQKL